MASPFFFFRPILAEDSSWAAFDWQPSTRASANSADYVKCFSGAGVAPLANTMPLIMSINPVDLSDSGFIDMFEASQVVFFLPGRRLRIGKRWKNAVS